MEIYIYNQTNWLCPLDRTQLQALVFEMYTYAYAQMKGYKQEEFIDLASLALHIVRDSDIIQANRDYMNCDSPTNILSFPAVDIGVTVKEYIPPNILMLSVDTFERECFLYAQNKNKYLVHLLAHGIAHVLGYEHGEEMFSFCEKIENWAIKFLTK